MRVEISNIIVKRVGPMVSLNPMYKWLIKNDQACVESNGLMASKKAMVFTDYWKAYQAVIPNDQHHPVGKETGETAYVERWNNIFRQHVARFVRKTLSSSKCIIMHEICLKLFLHRYNT